MTDTNSESWGSRIGLILAMAGNAVGLGNFLRFPVQAVQNGGGEFIIPYLVCFLLMGIPLLFVEWGVGRFGGRHGDHSTPFILDRLTKKSFWKYFGVFGLFTNFGVIAYYTYIESWTLSYVISSITGTFNGMDQSALGDHFTQYVGSAEGGMLMNNPSWALIAFVFTLALNVWILSKGLSGGVEKVAKIAMPLLIGFGVILVIRAFTLDTNIEGCVDCAASEGFNFLWQPNLDGIWNLKTWMAAAGQVFFTLSVGMGTIQCYASYVKSKDDIALNAMSAGFMNEFVEIVLGASVVIPIAAGYLGLDWIKENAGFMMAFKSMPYLFDQWPYAVALLSSVAWFGLLFFAGITSSLAMGTPWMGFMEQEFGWNAKKSAWTFGGIVLILAMPTIFFFDQGVFDEYDYWTGTVSLVVFAMVEVILFAWVFGINNAWNEINRGADIKVPVIFKYIMKYVTPVLILVVFIGATIKPATPPADYEGNEWTYAFESLSNGKGWELDNGSIIGTIVHKGIVNREYFADEKLAESDGVVQAVKVREEDNKYIIKYESGQVSVLNEKVEILVQKGDAVTKGQVLAKGSFTNPIFFKDMSRLLLVIFFLTLCFLVYKANQRRKLKL